MRECGIQKGHDEKRQDLPGKMRIHCRRMVGCMGPGNSWAISAIRGAMKPRFGARKRLHRPAKIEVPFIYPCGNQPD